MPMTSSPASRLPHHVPLTTGRPSRTGDAPCHALLALPAHDVHVASARHFTADWLAFWGLPGEERDTATLIVGELAANAALHGRSDMTLRLCLADDALHITVTDHGTPSPHGTPAHRDADEYGRGMHIVSVLSDRLEISYRPGGWSVRAVVAVRKPCDRCAAWRPGHG
ncbi:regulatory protein (plasmid) [Streptantibioticus cattleyicolor NRRL 8057 = DSM 46488]|uniref:Regulatory protein n=2 Tax=Streptantibioticus cattleyicolor TaxID=29303 RepID=G8XHK5_STREN|nr:regulatory protein [Streptantibioticus cattleyicolor NRRL 8057 = DSM 46488]